MTAAFLETRNVSKTFRQGTFTVEAVRDVSIGMARGECLAVVGESGSGKSTIANMILGVTDPTAGQIVLDGEVLPERRRLGHRRRMQLVQQNPLSALNPNRTVGASVRLALDVHGVGGRAQRRERVGRLLQEVGLDPGLAARYPAHLSGGQRQRVAIARARACDSDLIVLDEPTSALDVIVQARILKLLNSLRERRALTYLFITHDLAVVRTIADRVAVLRRGEIVETGDAAEVFNRPQHPYTRSLIAVSPVITEDELAFRDRIRNSSTGERP